MCGRFVAIGSLFEFQERHGEYLIQVYSEKDGIQREDLRDIIKRALLVLNVRSDSDIRREIIKFYVSFS